MRLRLQKPGVEGAAHVTVAEAETRQENWAPAGEGELDGVNATAFVFGGVSLIDSQLVDRVSVWTDALFGGGSREIARSVSPAGKLYDVWSSELRFEPGKLTVTTDRDRW